MRIESSVTEVPPSDLTASGRSKRRRVLDCRRLLLLVLCCLLLCQTSVQAGKGPADKASPDGSGVLEELKSAAEKGNLTVQWELGSMYYRGDGVPESYSEARKWFQKAADQGDPWAQLALAHMLQEGQGVLKDGAGAMKWRMTVAEQGHPLAQVAQYQVGNMYYFGEGVPQDYALAVKWFKRAADAGDPQAQFSLAFMYQMGLGVPRNPREALKWYRDAAEQGDPEAQTGLAARYYDGEGIPKNRAEAAKWYRKAAEQGDSWAQKNLAVIYMDGQGVTQNNTEAFFWADMAAARGNGEAMLLRQELSRTLPPDQMAQALKLCARWKYRFSNPSLEPQSIRNQSQEGSSKSDQQPSLIAGTGFVMSREGHVLTSYHAIEGCTTIAGELDGKPVSLSLVNTDIRNDLAVLKTAGPGHQHLRFRDGKPVDTGDAVFVIGYPLQDLPAYQVRVTKGTVSAMTGPGNDPRVLQLKAPLQPANDGGPLLDAAGNVAGMITAKSSVLKSAELGGNLPHNLSFALNAGAIRTFLNDSGVHYESADSKKKLEASQVESLAKKAAVLIVCLKEKSL